MLATEREHLINKQISVSSATLRCKLRKKIQFETAHHTERHSNDIQLIPI